MKESAKVEAAEGASDKKDEDVPAIDPKSDVTNATNGNDDAVVNGAAKLVNGRDRTLSETDEYEEEDSLHLVITSDEEVDVGEVKEATPLTAPLLEAVSPPPPVSAVVQSGMADEEKSEESSAVKATSIDLEGTDLPVSTVQSSPTTGPLTTDINDKSESDSKEEGMCVNNEVSLPNQEGDTSNNSDKVSDYLDSKCGVTEDEGLDERVNNVENKEILGGDDTLTIDKDETSANSEVVDTDNGAIDETSESSELEKEMLLEADNTEDTGTDTVKPVAVESSEPETVLDNLANLEPTIVGQSQTDVVVDDATNEDSEKHSIEESSVTDAVLDETKEDCAEPLIEGSQQTDAVIDETNDVVDETKEDSVAPMIEESSTTVTVLDESNAGSVETVIEVSSKTDNVIDETKEDSVEPMIEELSSTDEVLDKTNEDSVESVIEASTKTDSVLDETNEPIVDESSKTDTVSDDETKENLVEPMIVESSRPILVAVLDDAVNKGTTPELESCLDADDSVTEVVANLNEVKNVDIEEKANEENGVLENVSNSNVVCVDLDEEVKEKDKAVDLETPGNVVPNDDICTKSEKTPSETKTLELTDNLERGDTEDSSTTCVEKSVTSLLEKDDVIEDTSEIKQNVIDSASELDESTEFDSAKEIDSKMDESYTIDIDDESNELDLDTMDVDDNSITELSKEDDTSKLPTADNSKQYIKDVLKSSVNGDSDKVAKINGASDTGEGVNTSTSKLKRTSQHIADEVAVKRSKLNGMTVNTTNTTENDENDESVAVKPSLKRTSEKMNPLLEVKKVRIGVEVICDADMESDKDETVDEEDAVSKAEQKKKLTNLERAIDRVAAGGLSKKRERQICEFIALLEDKALTHITTNDLEELVCHKLCQVVTEKSEVGHMRETVNSLSASVEKWRASTRQMSKQIKDLELVFKRLVADSKVHPQTSVPIKITRSVGLQVGQPLSIPAAAPAAPAVPPVTKKTLATRNEASKANQQRPGGIMTNRNVTVTNPTTPTRPSLPSTSTSPNLPPAAAAPKVPLVVNRVVGPPVRTPVSVVARPPNIPPMPGNISLATKPAVRTIPAQTGQPRLRMATPPTQQARLIRPAPTTPTTSFSSNQDTLIDLTDEDDKKTVAPPSAATTMKPKFSPNNAIRVVNQNQLTGNNAQLTGSRNLTTMTRPAAGQTQMIVIPSGNSTAVRSTGQARIRAVVPPFPQTVNRVRPLAQSTATPVRTIYRQVLSQVPLTHPAPLPQLPSTLSSNTSWKLAPPQPDLKISKSDQRQKGIILSWKMDMYSEDQHEAIATYQLYAYQETSTLPNTNMWKKVGDVKSMPLPMACTLTQFSEGNKYHFAVRALDIRGRNGPFSIPGSILLTPGD